MTSLSSMRKIGGPAQPTLRAPSSSPTPALTHPPLRLLAVAALHHPLLHLPHCRSARPSVGAPKPGAVLLPVHSRVRKPGCATSAAASAAEEAALTELGRKYLQRATTAVRGPGRASFFVQVFTTLAATLILLFSVFSSSTPSTPTVSLLLTAVGVALGGVSSFCSYAYVLLGDRMRRWLTRGSGTQVLRADVVDVVLQNVMMNMAGLAAAMLGVQALVGVLVAKTLANASANPFLAISSAASSANLYNPVLFLDVFVVQAASLCLLAHFASLCCGLWVLKEVNDGRGERFFRFLSLQRLRQKTEETKNLASNSTKVLAAAADRIAFWRAPSQRGFGAGAADSLKS